MRPHLACVKIEVVPPLKLSGWESPGTYQVWVFDADENYSLERVQEKFVEENREIFGGMARVVGEVGRAKSAKKLIAWAHRKGRNRHGLPPMTGWCGPLRLAP